LYRAVCNKCEWVSEPKEDKWKAASLGWRHEATQPSSAEFNMREHIIHVEEI
jgi:hypothetical protein